MTNDQPLILLSYSLIEAAKATCLSSSTLKLCILSGELKARKARGRTIITAGDLEEFINSRPLIEPRAAKTA